MLFQRALESRHESALSTARNRQLKSVKTGKLKSKNRCSEVTVNSLGNPCSQPRLNFWRATRWRYWMRPIVTKVDSVVYLSAGLFKDTSVVIVQKRMNR